MPEGRSLGRVEAWVLIASQPFAQLSNQALFPTLGILREDLALSYGELGIVVAAFGIARLVMDLPAGRLVERFNLRSVLIVSLMFSALGSITAMLSEAAWQLVAARALIGLASASAHAATLAWLVGGAGGAERGRILARGEAFFSVMALVIPPLGGALAAIFSWRVAFAIGTVAALAGALGTLLWTSPASATRAMGQSGEHAGEAVGTAPLGWAGLRIGGSLLLAGYLVGFLAFFSRAGLLTTLIPVIGADQIGLTPAQIGLILSLSNVAGIGAVMLGGMLSDRWGRRRLLLPGVAVVLVTQLALFLVDDLATYVVFTVTLGFSFFVNALPPSVIGDALPAALRSRGIAVYRVLSDVGLLAAPVAVGLALEVGGFQAAKLSAAAVTVLVLLALGWLLGRRG